MFVITVKKFLKGVDWRVLTARNAVYVENISGVPGEEEIIFPSGSEFLIDNI